MKWLQNPNFSGRVPFLQLHNYTKGRDQQLFAMKVVHYADEKIPVHCHDYYELVVIQNGDGYHFLDGKTARLFHGNVLLIQPGQVHTYQDFSHLTLLTFMFHPDMLKNHENELRPIDGFQLIFGNSKAPGFRMLDDITLSRLSLLVEHILNEQLTLSSGYRFAMTLYFLEALLLICRECRIVLNPSAKNLKIAGVISYLDKNYEKELSLKKLAILAGMSLTNFRRDFKEKTEKSPIQYLLNLRIQKASEMLSSSSLSLADIALKVGFQSTNYFVRQFTRIKGTTPGAYRKQDHGIVNTPGLDLTEHPKVEKLRFRKLK